MAPGQIRSEIGKSIAEQKKREKPAGGMGGGWGWGKKPANPEELNSELDCG